MADKKKKHEDKSKQNLLIAIGVVSVLLVVLVVVLVGLSGNEPATTDQNPTQTTGSTVPSTPSQSGTQGDPQPSDDPQTATQPQTPEDNIPTEAKPLVLSQGVYVVHMGNFSGRYVEDGSDAQLENFCAVIVENRTEKTIQLLQFKITSADQEHAFRLTTLPPGERAIVQDLNRATFMPDESFLAADVEMCLFFNEEPSLYEDIFAISGTENGLELRNRTKTDIPGPIYVYYKTRTAEGFAGGITYRITVPGLEANAIYNASVNHFWPGSSQVMFIEYAQ